MPCAERNTAIAKPSTARAVHAPIELRLIHPDVRLKMGGVPVHCTCSIRLAGIHRTLIEQYVSGNLHPAVSRYRSTFDGSVPHSVPNPQKSNS